MADKDTTVYKKMEQGLDQLCEFNDNRDVQEVVSGLAVDINDMLQTGVIKDSVYEEDNNGISEPQQVLGRISDTFDAIEASRAIRKYGKKAAPVVESSVETGSAGSPAADVKKE